MSGREDYNSPVWFAREPVAERRRWIGRFFLLLFVVALFWLTWTRVVHTQSDTTPVQQRSELPSD